MRSGAQQRADGTRADEAGSGWQGGHSAAGTRAGTRPRDAQRGSHGCALLPRKVVHRHAQRRRRRHLPRALLQRHGVDAGACAADAAVRLRGCGAGARISCRLARICTLRRTAGLAPWPAFPHTLGVPLIASRTAAAATAACALAVRGASALVTPLLRACAAAWQRARLRLSAAGAPGHLLSRSRILRLLRDCCPGVRRPLCAAAEVQSTVHLTPP